MRWQEKAGYRIPNMNNLKGRKGRRILEEIRNLPAPDFAPLQKEVDVYVAKIVEERNNNNLVKRLEKKKK